MSALCAVCAMSAVSAADGLVLLSVRQDGVPAVKNRVLTYTTDLIFETAPENFWAYFDKKQSSLIIDMYGEEISAPDSISCKGSQVFHSVKVNNLETGMSLSGKQAQIVLACDTGWHFESRQEGANRIRIESFKLIDHPKTTAKSRSGRIVFINVLAASAAAVATFLIIWYIGRTGD